MFVGEDLFLVTKLPPGGNRPEGVAKYLKKSLENLQVSYLDLYLVHTPFSFKDVEGNLHPIKDGKIDFDPTTDHVAVWKVKSFCRVMSMKIVMYAKLHLPILTGHSGGHFKKNGGSYFL